MALLPFRGIDTPCLPAQGQQRRLSYGLLHVPDPSRQIARKCSSANTRSADDRLPCFRSASRDLISAEIVIPRSVAISLSACQNGSSRLTLVLRSDKNTECLGTRPDVDGGPCSPLLVHDRPRSQLALNAAIAPSRHRETLMRSGWSALVEHDRPHPRPRFRMPGVRPEDAADNSLAVIEVVVVVGPMTSAAEKKARHARRIPVLLYSRPPARYGRPWAPAGIPIASSPFVGTQGHQNATARPSPSAGSRDRSWRSCVDPDKGQEHGRN